jgi:arylformamidase
MELIDISPEVHSGIAVWPGDQPFERKIALDMKDGANLTLSSIHTTVHLGAHTDAPNHYAKEGTGIAERSLDYYYGPCQVLEVSTPRGERILPEHLSGEVTAPRVLLKTGSYPDPNFFNEDFCSLSKALVEHRQLTPTTTKFSKVIMPWPIEIWQFSKELCWGTYLLVIIC